MQSLLGFHTAWPALWQCLQEQIVCRQILRRLAFCSLDLGTTHGWGDHRRHTVHDLILNIENINKLAIEPISPDLAAIHGICQLDDNSQPMVRFSDATSKYVAHAKIGSDLRCVHSPALESKGRAASDNK